MGGQDVISVMPVVVTVETMVREPPTMTGLSGFKEGVDVEMGVEVGDNTKLGLGVEMMLKIDGVGMTGPMLPPAPTPKMGKPGGAVALDGRMGPVREGVLDMLPVGTVAILTGCCGWTSSSTFAQSYSWAGRL